MKGNGNILVVDDDPQILDLTTAVLERARYEVLAARTGKECLDLVRTFSPDLVLLDVMLPDIEGTEVCTRIKTDPLLGNTFVILVSGIKTSSEFQANGLNGGADGYIIKPISNKELIARVQSLVRIKQSEDALHASEARYRRLFEAASEGIMILDGVSGEIKAVNPFLERMLKYSSEELVGKLMGQIPAFGGGEEGRAAFSELKRTLPAGYIHLLLRTKDGQDVDAEIGCNSYEERGEPVIQCNIRDVTQRRLAEEALRKAHIELDRRVKERTAQLSESNRLLSQEIAERKIGEKALKKSEERLRYLSNYLQKILEQETVRLSREIHDELGQVLTGIKMDAEWTAIHLPEDATTVRERMKLLITYIDNAIHTVQRISTRLRPPVLDDCSLVEAIEAWTDDFQKRTGIACEVIGGIRQREPEKEIRLEMFRILQESLTNVARHSGAVSVVISLYVKRNRYVMEISDDGRGITKREMMDAKSIGLTGMHERADAMGGTLSIGGVRGKGTTVKLSVPFGKGMIAKKTVALPAWVKVAQEGNDGGQRLFPT
ncbi:MAG TPA: response regulator [Syntrophorhabdaceae bacterium]|jgi:PAS domain S-box-containing protein